MDQQIGVASAAAYYFMLAVYKIKKEEQRKKRKKDGGVCLYIKIEKEHVWHVVILTRGLGTGRTGEYKLCLTEKTLTLIKKEGKNLVYTFKLSNVRSCGSLRNYIFIEVGRSSLLGPGEIWMESEDPTIAQNIHSTLFNAMSSNRSDEDMRKRSSSATESSKPLNNRKLFVSGIPKMPTHIFNVAPPNHVTGGVQSSPSTTINHQRTQSLPITDNPPNTTPVPPPSFNNTNTVPSSVATDSYAPFHPSTRGTITTTTIVNKTRANQNVKCRERCDSMPSRPRTTSEGTHPVPTWRSYLTANRSHGRDFSHSPPTGSPISPPSISTDSAGSSHSLTDETDMMSIECPDTGRYNGIPLTPDEAIAEEECPESPCGMYDSYVPMAPQSSDDGYVDMSPRCRYNYSTHSPTASVSSVVSGTPSTDIRFSDYPLDKVTSYLASDEDDTRPARAYSIGSKPETSKGKKHVELSENARVRAFSVGSKSKKGPSRILPQQQHPSLKSISAPLLSNSRTHSSHSSLDPMDDLMEMDFSKTNNNSGTTNTTNNNGYVEMKPGVEIIHKKPEISPYVDMSGSYYMDMSGTSPSSRHEEDYSSFVDINRQYRLPTNNNYMDMDPRKNGAKPSTSPAWSNDYYDMSSNTRRSERGSSFSSQLSTSSSPRNPDYISMNFSRQEPKTPEGYVEMSIGKKHQRQGSLDGNHTSSINEDYLNMSVGPKKKPSKTQKVVSQPISIHPATTNSQVTKNSSSPISISSLLGRKSSTGTSPKMFLPLSSWSTNSPYSSLPRQRPRKDSKDSSSSSVTTPSSSSTIFPMSLNSPSSPLKSTKTETPSTKSSIFSHFYKNKSNSDDYAVMDFEVNRYDREKDKENSDYVNYCPAVDRTDKYSDRLTKRETNNSSGDYAIMQPGPISRSGSLDTSPLIGHLSLIGIKESQSMCFQPIKEDCVSSPVEDKRIDDSMDTSDYTDLNPPTSNYEYVSPAAKISRPNSVNSDNINKPASLARCTSTSSDTSRSATSLSEIWSSSSTLVNSRPESVNSDRIDTNLSNNSLNKVPKDPKDDEKPETKLHYASLDLKTQDEEGRSPRTTKNPQSSTDVASSSGQGETPTFVYAEIDFIKSEGLKQQNNNNNQSLSSTNTKVKN